METDKIDYSKTLNLPKTEFPMKANLPLREPDILKFWEDNNIYKKVLEKNRAKTKRILHDGPPYSNGRIHLGQAFNKILKDIVTKFWTMRGFYSLYVPGWDTHGLPNELEAIKSFKLDRKAIPPMELRNKCRESALHFVKVQADQFKRLGIQGEWEHPYLTLDHTYEAAIVDAFGVMNEKGFIYRGKRSVHWCYTCETALAEAEIEHKEKQSPSIYVKFRLKDGKLLQLLKSGVKRGLEEFRKNPAEEGSVEKFEKANTFLEKENPYVLIWTTTPWTLPGNVAVAIHPDEEYALSIASDGVVYFFAEKLIPQVEKATGFSFFAIAGLRGEDACKDRPVAEHPFLNRDSVLICQDYVTMEDGTGCVHTAPGHGQEDFEAAKLYHLPILVPVNERGILTEEAGRFAGLHVNQANEKIPEYLKETGHLLASGFIQHSYPHCWRCRQPVIFRATEQWFVAVDHDKLRDQAITSLSHIKWHPAWGEERMRNTILQRPDWCISRQRIWGVPIPVFYCEGCGSPIHSKESIESVRQKFLQEGADSWFTRTAEELLPAGFVCPSCHAHKGFRKEMDIFDVWYESGVSHHAVLETREALEWPSQLYLEGPDQYRGWFQVSLLTGMAVKEASPYKEILTHGWTLDLDGRAMHKSLGNTIDPMDIVKNYGAEVLRLFFASVDFKNDVRIGDKVLKDISEAYRKIRNTARFLLGNLFDFDPEKHSVSYQEMFEIDRWVLSALHKTLQNVTGFYEEFDFHLVYYHLLNFCVNELSAVYFDVLKDKLYTAAPNSKERRSSQTALHAILMTLIRMLFPILSFTSEEIWQVLPGTFKKEGSVHLSEWPSLPEAYQGDKEFSTRWEKLLGLREKVYARIEEARQQKEIRQPLEAEVRLFLPIDEFHSHSKDALLLKEILIVSKLTIEEKKSINESEIVVSVAPGKKCPRCWHFEEKFSTNAAFPDVCFRCQSALEASS